MSSLPNIDHWQPGYFNYRKKTLLEYYAYEFLKPLRSIGLMPTDNYDVWKTKHFLVKFQLNEEKAMDLYFKLNPINSQYESQYLPLLTIYSDTHEKCGSTTIKSYIYCGNGIQIKYLRSINCHCLITISIYS